MIVLVIGALFCLGLGWYAGFHEGRKRQCQTDCESVNAQVAAAIVENTQGE